MSDPAREAPWWARVAFQLLAVVLTVTWPPLMGISAWAASKLLDLDSRVIAIESSRYTRADAKAEREELLDALKELRDEVRGNRRATEVIGQRLSRIEAIAGRDK